MSYQKTFSLNINARPVIFQTHARPYDIREEVLDSGEKVGGRPPGVTNNNWTRSAAVGRRSVFLLWIFGAGAKNGLILC